MKQERKVEMLGWFFLGGGDNLKGLSEKVTSEQRPERGEGGNYLENRLQEEKDRSKENS